jgi:hypothetical protein
MWWCWCAEKNRVRRRRQNLVSLDNYGDFFHRRGNWALLLFAPMVSRICSTIFKHTGSKEVQFESKPDEFRE